MRCYLNFSTTDHSKFLTVNPSDGFASVLVFSTDVQHIPRNGRIAVYAFYSV